MPARIEIPRFHPAAFKQARERLRLSRDDLARHLHLTRHAVYTWEHDLAPIPARALREAARVLRVTPAALQHRLSGPPTLADLRSLVGLSQPELADRIGIKVARLACWEDTGHLGRATEQPPVLAATLGLGPQLIAGYLETNQVPAAIRHRLAHVLRVRPDDIQAAFDTTRAQHLRAMGQPA
jgi:DNA-binding transcriptional regulator YiaG